MKTCKELGYSLKSIKLFDPNRRCPCGCGALIDSAEELLDEDSSTPHTCSCYELGNVGGLTAVALHQKLYDHKVGGATSVIATSGSEKANKLFAAFGFKKTPLGVGREGRELTFWIKPMKGRGSSLPK